MPAILTPALAERALATVRPAIATAMAATMPERAGVAVVVAATAAVDPAFASSGEAFRHACFLVGAIGDPDASPYPNSAIALRKAELSARTGRPSASLPPHYLREGDTVFWGSAVLEGIVVACAGLEPRYDEMVAHWIAAAVQAECRGAMDLLMQAEPDRSFL